jgi:uncharacterized protein with von Willebrand factor type A (vWA) domain
MLLDFLFELRARRVPVGLQEWMALLEGLARGLHESSLTGFYHLGRALLVHSEAHFDAYDQAFARCFEGVELESRSLAEELEAWLRDPARLAYLSPEERALLAGLSLEELRRELEERLREQRGRHQGGNRWVGSGGTSPFGLGGYHPTGVRIGGSSGARSAAQVAAERRFRSYRADLVLDVRQIKMALRKLRELRRDGSADELDLERSVDKTCRNAGELELVWRPPRRNNVKLLLAMDVGGSMDPHARVVSQLFSAAAQSKHFRDFHAFYFHNCVYDRVYKDSAFREALAVAELTATFGPSYKLVMVGDALMHPMELLDPGGALDYWYHNVSPGIFWLGRLAHHFPRRVWLNPEPPRFWRHVTVQSIRELFPMFPLTLDGLGDAVAALVRARAAAPHDRGAEASAFEEDAPLR